jgi:hypothetical protein
MMKLSEAQIVQSYLRLLIVPEGDQGVKHVALRRFGQFEVRLCEPAGAADSGDAAFRLELYAHDRARAIDSAACRDSAQAVAVARELAFWAKWLDRRSRQTRAHSIA